MDVKLVDGVRHLYLSELNNISEQNKYSLRAWLLESNNFIIEPKYSNVFKLSLYEPLDFLGTIAFDINRLSIASIETLSNINYETVTPKFLAWKLINYYYSAFFSAHSILKLLGFGLVQIDERIAMSLKRRALSYGYEEAIIHKGTYCFDVLSQLGQVIFYKVDKYSDSHQGLWHRFADLLDVLVANSIKTGFYNANCIQKNSMSSTYPDSVFANLPQDDAVSLSQKLEELKKIINKRGNNNWLSSVRNILNYNHEYGVWFPYNGYLNNYDRINRSSKLCFHTPMEDCFRLSCDDDLNTFVICCQFINAINFEILNDLTLRHPDNKSFLKKGFDAYKKMYCQPA